MKRSKNYKLFRKVFLTVVTVLAIFKFSSHLESKSKVQMEIVKEEYRSQNFVADLFYNKHQKKSRVIVLLGGSEGGLSWSSEYDAQNRADLISRGYALLSLGYFKYQNYLPLTLEEIPLEYFNNAICWALRHKRTKGQKVAVMGSSKGGEAALLIASQNHKVKAVAALVPSAFVFEGIGEKRTSSWSEDNDPIRFAKFIHNDTFFKALQTNEWVEVYREAAADPLVREETAIEIEDAKADIFLLSGKYDKVWPSYDMSNYIIDRLVENDYKYHYEHKSFDAGHWVAFYPEAWLAILNFFDKHYPAK